MYAIIIAGSKSPRKLDKPAAALIGSVLLVLTGVLTKSEAQQAISLSTITLLFGMMIVVYFSTSSGLLDSVARGILRRCRTPRVLLAAVCASSAILSALFVNDTICLLMTPLVLNITRRSGLHAEPYLIGLATSSNVGSVMTLTGNPQNMLIGQSSGWGWGAFALRMVPVGLVCLLINTALVTLIYRSQVTSGQIQSVPENGSQITLDRKMATKTIWVMAGLLVAFLAGMPMDLAALTASTAILVLANRPPEEAFASVDWSLLLFFAGLFVVVAGITKTQSHWIGVMVPGITHHPGSLSQLLKFSGVTIVGGNLFSNVPFVMLLRGWLIHAHHAKVLWLMLAAASTLAGNLTLLGSVANLIVAQKAKEECPLSFTAFLKVGVATTLLTTLASVLIIWGYARAGWV